MPKGNGYGADVRQLIFISQSYRSKSADYQESNHVISPSNYTCFRGESNTNYHGQVED
jgi:hypothetical protein